MTGKLKISIYLTSFSNGAGIKFVFVKRNTVAVAGSEPKIVANMVSCSRGRVKLELKLKADEEFKTNISIDRSSGFKKWLNI